MVELVLLIPVMIIGLMIYLVVDVPKIAINERETLLGATEQAEKQLTEEMKAKVIVYYGTEATITKKLITYDDYYKEIKKIEQNYNNK